MRTKRVHLKVKVKSLAEEARIIRKEEKKNKLLREDLYLHRIKVVRREAFLSLIAYGFLRGRPIEAIIPKCRKRIYKTDWAKIGNMIDKYGVYRHIDISELEYTKLEKEQRIRFEDWKEKYAPVAKSD